MLTESAIPAPLLQGYLETEYHVYAEPPFTLRVGVACPALQLAHRHHRATTSAFITAFNPFSQSLELPENKARQQELAHVLTRRSLVFLPGLGEHPSKQWPGEESFLVFDLSLEAAKVLGEQFEQNAILWSGGDAVPQLVLLR